MPGGRGGVAYVRQVDGAESEHDRGGNNGRRAQHHLRHVAPPAPFSSPKSSRPQRMPTSEFVFHSGKAMARPTSRIAKTVSVLATAHSIPARHREWELVAGCVLRSRNTARVPLSSVGTLQRATKTPATMQSEIEYGDRPAFTSLVGASAAPSQTPAPNAAQHAQPVSASGSRRSRWSSAVGSSRRIFLSSRMDATRALRLDRAAENRSMQRDEERKADAKNGEGNEEVAVGEDGPGLLKKSHQHPLELRDSAGANIKTGLDGCQGDGGSKARFHAKASF